jgi:GT2 family glycosyltransferase
MNNEVGGVGPEVSIIVVTWNARKYVEECLDSIRQTRGVRYELIVVDNASSDGTPDLVREQFPETILIETGANLGFAKGNNVGIRRAKGRYLFLINSDVNVPTGCIEALFRHLEENPDIALLGPQMLGPDGAVHRSTMRFPTLWNTFCRALALDRVFRKSKRFGGFLMTDFRHDRTVDVEVLNGWFWAARRKAVEQVGLLDEQFFMYGEDIDWCYRFRKAAWRVVFYSGAAALHYGGGSSAAAPLRFYLEMQRANLQFWQKHRHRSTCMAYRLMAILHECARIAGFTTVYMLGRLKRQDASFKAKRSVAAIDYLAGMADHDGK